MKLLNVFLIALLSFVLLFTASSVSANEAAVIASETHPNQSKWYKDQTIKLSWSKPENYRDFSYELLLTSSGTVKEADTNSSSIEFGSLKDGIWKFNLTTNFADSTSKESSFVFNVDTTASTKPIVTVAQENRSDQFPLFKLASIDSASGVSYHEIKIDNQPLVRTPSSSIKVRKQLPGSHNYEVISVDAAGNISDKTTGNFFIEGVPGPVILDNTTLVSMLQPVDLSGTARYGSIVEIYIDGQKADRFFVSEHLSQRQERKSTGFTSNEKVGWSYSLKQSLSSGQKSLFATEITNLGEDSFRSNIVNFSVLAGWVTVLGIAFPIPVFFWLTLLLLALAGLLIFMLLQTKQKALEDRTKSLRVVVNKDLDSLKKTGSAIERTEIEKIKEQIDNDLAKK